MAEHYYTVGTHGSPTKETAPHGYMWRAPMNDNVMGPWMAAGAGAHVADQRAEWYPLPAPPTEQAPPPVPVARWVATWDHDGWLVRSATPDDGGDGRGAVAAAAALNTLEADGVVWGPGRPPSGLAIGDNPDVLVQTVRGEVLIRTAAHVRNRAKEYVGWWPLPGEAT